MSPKRSRFALPSKDYKVLLTCVFQRDGWKCRACRSRSNLHGHHIVYRSHGGGDYSSNLITLCNHCHKWVHEFIRGGGLLVLAMSGKPGDEIDADEGVKFWRVNGWTPRPHPQCPH